MILESILLLATTVGPEPELPLPSPPQPQPIEIDKPKTPGGGPSGPLQLALGIFGSGGELPVKDRVVRSNTGAIKGDTAVIRGHTARIVEELQGNYGHNEVVGSTDGERRFAPDDWDGALAGQGGGPEYLFNYADRVNEYPIYGPEMYDFDPDNRVAKALHEDERTLAALEAYAETSYDKTNLRFNLSEEIGRRIQNTDDITEKNELGVVQNTLMALGIAEINRSQAALLLTILAERRAAVERRKEDTDKWWRVREGKPLPSLYNTPEEQFTREWQGDS